ncbi:MAG: transketolase C-terminal domain-containing protein [Methanoculleus sp.]|jgi:pyruvate ferredoxin oxidoreductase alpha subunit|nr:pyruvate ferredoxin oxidoreductase [Methanoculleus sp.]MBP8676162.1 pyruvate ferredoxin oxidoreductase [Methanoculleus sp.]HIH86218.1 pyruvate ferredoxin oxidoreductase [Methanoculleus sp.]HOB06718.1 transketolase C-terminal domain-containing protein [Methanoculleus sp.]HOD85300.1 transketolase C-terminal domain-containing protein [Methanoculleus sp.]
MLEIMEGSHAVAEIVKRCRPQVIAAYPITPQTHIVEALAQMVADCELDADYITVESEFSALSACLGASAAGSRVYSATTSQGLALMFEVCFNVAGLRQPVVMTIANRSLGAPLSIWNDQQDSISLRDSGWLQVYAEDNQEAVDLHMIAYRVCEDHDVLLPAFVCFDGYVLTHTYEPVSIPTQEEVDAYLPAFNPYQRLDASNPMSFGMYATPDYYMEFRYEIDRAQHRAKEVFAKAGREFAKQFDRDYSAPVEGYRLEDADTAIVAMGSICGTAKDAVDEMRDAGKNAGLLKIRMFRPFPAQEIVDALKGVSTVAVLDRNISLGSGGGVGTEVKAALSGSGTAVYDYIVALGGRDIRKKDIAAIVDLAEEGRGDMFYGLRTEVL